MERRRLSLVILFAAAALISGFTLLRGIDPFDEGIALQAARRLEQGQTLYTTGFGWAYGPAQPYVLAGLFKAFGVSLLQWRILRALVDAAIAVLVYVLLRRYAGRAIAVLGWLAAACTMADPRSANPFPLALLLALAAIALASSGWRGARERTAAAAALAGLAAAFRLDFALYGIAAVAATTLLADGVPWTERLRRAGAGTALAAGVALAVYVPFMLADGPGRLYDALIGTSLKDRGAWTLPFPLSYGGPLRAAHAARDLKDVVDYYQPLLTVVGLALAAVALASHLRARDGDVAARAGLVVFSAGGLSYLLSRTDAFHAQPLAVALAVLLPALAVHGLRDGGPAGRALGAAAACVFGLMLVHGVANRLSALVRPPAMSAVRVPAADGVEAPPREARALERVVADVHARVPPGRPMFVAPRRSDLVTVSNVVLYVLADRDDAGGRDFGLVARAPAQRAIVRRLRARRPRVVVRWTAALSSRREPNSRGRASGSHELDDYLRRAYRPLERLYHYDVLVARTG